eukprot:7894-Eustigmatos_ZCMA.PRE.1
MVAACARHIPYGQQRCQQSGGTRTISAMRTWGSCSHSVGTPQRTCMEESKRLGGMTVDSVQWLSMRVSTCV